jgi:hypothetical protein
MITDIDNFFDLVRLKNGQVKIKSNSSKKSNIYGLLRDFGFRVCKVGGRRVYYRRSDGKIYPISIHDIKDAFTEFLRSGELSNVPKDVSYQSIMNCYYSANPIKENEHFWGCLEETLNETKTHNYLLETDGDYKSHFEVQQLLSKFDELGFSKIIDSISYYSSNTPTLYYKRIAEEKFLVFNHWNVNSKYTNGFDSWVATYRNETHIGTKKPNGHQEIRLGFQLERDYNLIKHYFN